MTINKCQEIPRMIIKKGRIEEREKPIIKNE
jgi:hypothetical protein